MGDLKQGLLHCYHVKILSAVIRSQIFAVVWHWWCDVKSFSWLPVNVWYTNTSYSHRCCLMQRADSLQNSSNPQTAQEPMGLCATSQFVLLLSPRVLLFMMNARRGGTGSPVVPDGCQFPSRCLVSCSESSRCSCGEDWLTPRAFQILKEAVERDSISLLHVPLYL